MRTCVSCQRAPVKQNLTTDANLLAPVFSKFDVFPGYRLQLLHINWLDRLHSSPSSAPKDDAQLKIKCSNLSAFARAATPLLRSIFLITNWRITVYDI